MKIYLIIAMITMMILGPTTTAVPLTPTQTTVRISLPFSNAETNGASANAAISADGRFIAFQSHANNLVADDTNGQSDIFVYDQQTALMERVSVSSAGVEGNGGATIAALSADGRYVVFASNANNLVSNDTNAARDIFRRDRQTNTTIQISVSSAGVGGDYESLNPTISADGNLIAFDSMADNLIGDDTNEKRDIFVRNVTDATTMRVSLDSGGTPANDDAAYPAIAANGRFVAFASAATNLVPNDTNGFNDLFRHDLQTSVTSRLSVAADNTQSNQFSDSVSISADGRWVVFSSFATNLVPNDLNGQPDIFLRDNDTQAISLLSQGVNNSYSNGFSGLPTISADGSTITYTSWATNLIPDDTNGAADIFQQERVTGVIKRISLTFASTEANNASYSLIHTAASADGRIVTFTSDASNLVNHDNNELSDIFVVDGDGVLSRPWGVYLPFVVAP